MNDRQLTQTSKSISYLLRHGAIKEKVPYRSDGFILVKDVLNWINKGLNADEMVVYKNIETIVAADKKGRYTIKEINKRMYIRANQGHSFDVMLETIPITLDNVDDLGTVLHGTFIDFKASIIQNGLRRMSRQHVHMISMSNPEGFKLLRPDVTMFVIVDVKRAIQDGIEFCMSTNNVVLSEGNSEGCIPRQYLTFLERVKSPCSGVLVVAQDENNVSYLALVRTPKNQWSFPKGKKNKHEMSLKTAVRELEEETGIKSNELNFVELSPYSENSDNGHVASTYYTAFYNKQLNSSNLTLTPEDPGELTESRWIPLDNVVSWEDSDENGHLRDRRVDIAKRLQTDLVNRKLIQN